MNQLEEKFSEMRGLLRRDMRPNWAFVPRSTEEGYRRAIFDTLPASNSRANLVLIPANQSSPLHSFTTEHVIVHLSGRITWSTEGCSKVLAEAGDLLFIPARLQYTYANTGKGDAFFVSFNSRLDEYPGRGLYEGGVTVER